MDLWHATFQPAFTNLTKVSFLHANIEPVLNDSLDVRYWFAETGRQRSAPSS